MIDEKPVQSFDLPNECEMDHVSIYPSKDPEAPDFYAVPFVQEQVFDDGTIHFNEPPDFEVSEEYREAITQLADVDIEEIKLTRELETFTL